MLELLALLMQQCLFFLGYITGRSEFPPALNRAEEAELTAQEIDLGQNVVTDYDALCRFLDELPDVRKVDMFATKISRKDIEMLAARYPQVKFGWTMRVGDHLVRTDATAFSTLHNNQSATHTSADFSVLKYCTEMLALAIGEPDESGVSGGFQEQDSRYFSPFRADESD